MHFLWYDPNKTAGMLPVGNYCKVFGEDVPFHSLSIAILEIDVALLVVLENLSDVASMHFVYMPEGRGFPRLHDPQCSLIILEHRKLSRLNVGARALSFEPFCY